MLFNLTSTRSCIFVLLCCVASGQDAPQPYLAAHPRAENLTSAEELIQELSSKLVGFGAAVDIGKDLSNIEDVLFPIVQASPKNKYGRLDEQAARYALHRYFMQEHEWDIRTFDTANHSDEALPCLFNFGRQVPYEAQAVLEKRVVEQGASLTELSVFAALLEHLIHDEIPSDLVKEYKAMGLSSKGTITKEQAEQLIDFHMAVHLRADDASKYKPGQAYRVLKQIHMQFSHWKEALRFFRSTQEALLPQQNAFSFEDVLKVVNHLEDNFSHLVNMQCDGMKNKLLNMEMPGSGRVPLIDFYDSALSKGEVQFRETILYLRQLGALDESDPFEPRLVISNYVDGPSNCVASTSYYSACCFDECVQLYSRLEQDIGKPEATPGEILSVVRALLMPSGSQAAFIDELVQRLTVIAERSDGKVLLHGDAFTEWMHYAFPRECTNPKMFGRAHFLSVRDWMKETNLHPLTTAGDLNVYIRHLNRTAQERPVNSPEKRWIAPNITVPEAWIAQEHARERQVPVQFDGELGLLKGKMDDVVSIVKPQGFKQDQTAVANTTSFVVSEFAVVANYSSAGYLHAANQSDVERVPSADMPRASAMHMRSFKLIAGFGLAASILVSRTKTKSESNPLQHQAPMLSTLV